jgi:hypothetical protein
MMASRSSERVSTMLRPGGCKGIMKVLYFIGIPNRFLISNC